jgi:hypothetical protein
MRYGENYIRPGNYRTNGDGTWHEGQWSELVTIDRFWPGFIAKVLDDGQTWDWLMEYGVEWLQGEGLSKNDPNAELMGYLSDPVTHKDIVSRLIIDYASESDLFTSSSEPFDIALEATPGYFRITSEVAYDEIFFTITEMVTDLTPEDPETYSRKVEATRDFIRSVMRDVGINPLSVVINRGQV